MRPTTLARPVFAASLAALGVLSLLSGDFALNWQPVPAWLPWRAPLASVSGLVLLASGIGVLVSRTAAPAARVLAAYLLLWLLLLRVAWVVPHPLSAALWLGVGENLVLAAGGWILLQTIVERSAGVRLARVLFGIALPIIGLSHFVYARETAVLVPAWLPGHLGFAYLTGACHVAAGVAVLIAIVPRLAAELEAAMIGLFALLVWLPRAIAAPTNRFDWTAFFVSTAIAGAAWIAAGSLAHRSPARAAGPHPAGLS